LRYGCKPDANRVACPFARYSPTSAYRVVPDTRRVLRRVHNVPAQRLQCTIRTTYCAQIPPGEYSPLCARDRSATVKTFECLLSRHSTPRYQAVRIPRDTVSCRTRYPTRHGVLIQMDPPSQCDGRSRGWVLPCPLHPSPPPRHHFRAWPPAAVATCCGRCANVELRQVASSRVESRRVALRCVSIALRCVA
jgi:hypothetical protein